MKVKIDYTSREATVTEESTVFQHSHNIDIVQVAIDMYDPGLVYKMNFKDASGVQNISRYPEYIGQVDDLHYFRISLNSTNTKYAGDLAMSFAVFEQTEEGGITTTKRIWNSETFYQHVDESQEDDTVDIDSEESTIIDEIYAAISAKLKAEHKGYYYANTDLGVSGTLTTQEYLEAIIVALNGSSGDFAFSGTAIVRNDGAIVSDLPSGHSEVIVFLTDKRSGGSSSSTGFMLTHSPVANEEGLYYSIFNIALGGGLVVTDWRRILNIDDYSTIMTTIGNVVDGTTDIDYDNTTSGLTSTKIKTAVDELAQKHDDIENGTTIVGKATSDKDGNQIDTTYLKKSGGTMSGPINMGASKVTNMGDGVDTQDASTINNIINKIATHDSEESAHVYIRQLIEALEQEISRLNNRGKVFGEIARTTAELQTMDAATRASTIKVDIEAESWFDGTYTPENGHIVYDTGTGGGDNFHEWEYNGTAWVDNGAINSPKASNDVHGVIKGGNDYLSIVSGIVQVLLADNATNLKSETTDDKYTYEQIHNAIINRYTKPEVDGIIDDYFTGYGVEQTDLTPTALADTDTLALTALDGMNQVVFVCRDAETGEIDTDKVPVSELTEGTVLEFFESALVYATVGATEITFSDTGGRGTLKIYGVQLQPMSADQIDFETGTVGDKLKGVGTESVTYRNDGLVRQFDDDDVSVSPTYDANGDITKITETYDSGEVYETTFTKDKLGRIVQATKTEVI